MAACSVLLAACGGGGGGGSGTATAGDGVEPAAVESQGPSYYADVRNIIDAKCVTCHREGGTAPVPLASYDDVSRYHSALAYAVESGTMPPVGYAPLTGGERETLLDWLADPALPAGDPAQQPQTRYTWWRDARPIIEQRCSICHVEDGLAPFPLRNFDDVRAIRAAALHSVRQDTMPPWNPTRGYTRLQNNLSLTREEKAVLVEWLEAGAPEGEPVNSAKVATAGLEQVDWEIRLQMPKAYAPRVFPDEYRCFVVDWPETEPGYITASSYIPQHAAQIHHVFVTIVPPGSVADYKAAELVDGEPGYTCFGDTRIPGELPTSPPADVLGWGPGVNSKRLPAGTGIRIEPGSALALQIHFNTLTTEPRPEQSEMVFVTEESVERPGATAYVLDIANWIFASNMLIPAGEDDVSFQYEMPVSELKGIFNRPELGVGPEDPIAIQRASLHMHTLGKASRLSLVREDGTEQVILDARNWDFDWQNKYLLEEEVIVQSGDRIRTQCVYDNTEDNQPVFDGVALPVRDVRWGDGTTDEMCASTLFFTRVDKPRPPVPTLYVGAPEAGASFTPGELVPVELRLGNFILEPPASQTGSHAEHTVAGDGQGNGHPQRGHYHIYFDSDDDAADHITDWRQQPVIRIPQHLAPGLHRMRVSLRDSNHNALGVEDSLEFRVRHDADGNDGQPLVDHARWQQRLADTDPLAGHRPLAVSCPPAARELEAGALEIETGVCNYLALHQPSLVDIRKGDSLRFVLWHQQLRNAEPGRAHVALLLDGTTVWEQTVAIPNDGGFYDVTVEAPAELPAGSAVDFHLHNHGYNSWTLLGVERLSD